ncbi:MAG: acyltransferase [Clostridiales bacterium]|nr:acyltransferase [Clostridiales bacterium]
MTEKKKQYSAIDVAKLFCAILVVIIHIPPFGKQEASTAAHFLNLFFQNFLALFAVPFFFLASGFFVFRKDRSEGDFGYARKYILRLLRIYLIWSVIYFPFFFTRIWEEQGTIPKAILKYIRLSIFAGSYDHLWYLTALIFSVALIALLLHLKASPKAILICASVFYLFGLLGQSWHGLLTPLQTSAPSVYDALESFRTFISTTRDGLFEGFLFVSFGMFIAREEVKLKTKEAGMLCFLSVLLMVLEILFVHHFHLAFRTDIYLFLAPACIFGFILISRIEMPEKEIYRKLRSVSSLIFYLHPLCYIFALEILKRISTRAALSPAAFVLTLVLSVLYAVIIPKLSESKGFTWMRKLYE